MQLHTAVNRTPAVNHPLAEFSCTGMRGRYMGTRVALKKFVELLNHRVNILEARCLVQVKIAVALQYNATVNKH